MNIFKKVAVLYLFLSFLVKVDTFAQKSTLESYYPGGSEQFWDDFQKNFSFPSSTKTAKSYGTILIKLTLNSDGVPARILFLSQIDIDVVKSITRSLTKISKNWTSFPNDSDLYVSIRFSYNKDYQDVIEIDKSKLTKEFADYSYLIKTNENYTINYKKDYSQLLKSAKKAYKHSDFKLAKQAYSQLIGIDPYQLEYYQKRIELEALSGSKIYACTDVKVMTELLNYQGSIPLHGCN